MKKSKHKKRKKKSRYTSLRFRNQKFPKKNFNAFVLPYLSKFVEPLSKKIVYLELELSGFPVGNLRKAWFNLYPVSKNIKFCDLMQKVSPCGAAFYENYDYPAIEKGIRFWKLIRIKKSKHPHYKISYYKMTFLELNNLQYLTTIEKYNRKFTEKLKVNKTPR